MRLSEKTLELNFCAQATASVAPRRLLWFGLTQKEEAKLGFDACTNLGGRLLIFQFKASNQVVGSARRFRAPHGQMVRLQGLIPATGAVFYALPLLGSTADLARNPDVLGQSRLLDVATLPNPMPAPTKKNGALRRSGIHYLDAYSSHVTIHSDPVDVQLTPAAEVFEESADTSSVTAWFADFVAFEALRRALGPGARGAAILPRPQLGDVG